MTQASVNGFFFRCSKRVKPVFLVFGTLRCKAPDLSVAKLPILGTKEDKKNEGKHTEKQRLELKRVVIII